MSSGRIVTIRNATDVRTVRNGIPDVRRELDFAVDDALLHYAVTLDGGLRELADLRVIEYFRRAIRVPIRFAILFVIVERVAAATFHDQRLARRQDGCAGKGGDLREHDVHDDPGGPAVGWHSDVSQVFVIEGQDTFRREVRYCAADVEGLLVSFRACQAKVCDLNPRVGPRVVEQYIFGLHTTISIR